MAPATETIVLLHGTGRTPRSLKPLEKRLQAAGYPTLNLAYPWRSMDIPHLAAFVADTLAANGLCQDNNRLHFVTHSMGGLVCAYMLGDLRARFPAGCIGRVVMLGPPLQGSEVADVLGNWAAYRWLYGPAGQDLRTTSRLLDGTTPDYPLGIIAGTVGWPYPTGLLIPGAHDGRVAVARTRWAGMSDHLELPVMHSLLPSDRRVQGQVLAFIATGAFNTHPQNSP